MEGLPKIEQCSGRQRSLPGSMSEKSAYELAREATIASNRAKLCELGLEGVTPCKAPSRPRTPKAAKPKAEPTRASKRVRREAAPDPLPLPDDDDPSPQPRLITVPPERKRGAPRPPQSEESLLIGHVRRFIEENLPDNHTLEERRMFGMCMWMVRGNMFLGVGLQSDRMLVRVGEPAVEPLLEAHPEGVVRCGRELPGAHTVFPGTLMVEPAQYKGEAQMRSWFEHALAYNATMRAKEPSARPRKKKAAVAGQSSDADGMPPAESEHEYGEAKEAAAPPVAEPAAPSAADQSAPPRPRPASTAGGAFARCVLHVVKAIPPGRVASYGQVAQLAGAPRNARQVGHLLKEGLCAGGMPWWRVLGASGKSSLPVNGGGDTQRAYLEREGVIFRASGAVDPQMWWARAEPFYA